MKFTKLFLSVLLFVLCTGLSSRTVWPNDQVTAEAKKEGQLSLYFSINLTDANGIIHLFRQKYPFINVTIFRADNNKLLSRILTETSAGKFAGDVILISSFEVRVLMQKRLLQRYDSPERRYYPEGFTDKEGYWTSVYSIPRVMAYNTRLVNRGTIPETFEDLLEWRWKGNIGMPDSAFLWYTGMLNFYGEEKGRRFMRKLSAQKPEFRDSPTIISQLVAAGEFPLGLTYSHQVGSLKRKGAPVDWVRTMEPTVTGLKPISLSVKALHPNAGKLFIDFALCKEGQELLGSFNRIPDRSDVTSELKEGMKLYPADPTWGDSYRKRAEEFRQIFLK